MILPSLADIVSPRDKQRADLIKRLLSEAAKEGEFNREVFRDRVLPSVFRDGKFIDGFWMGLDQFLVDLSNPSGSQGPSCLSTDFLPLLEKAAAEGKLPATTLAKVREGGVCGTKKAAPPPTAPEPPAAPQPAPPPEGRPTPPPEPVAPPEPAPQQTDALPTPPTFKEWLASQTPGGQPAPEPAPVPQPAPTAAPAPVPAAPPAGEPAAPAVDPQVAAQQRAEAEAKAQAAAAAARLETESKAEELRKKQEADRLAAKPIWASVPDLTSEPGFAALGLTTQKAIIAHLKKRNVMISLRDVRSGFNASYAPAGEETLPDQYSFAFIPAPPEELYKVILDLDQAAEEQANGRPLIPDFVYSTTLKTFGEKMFADAKTDDGARMKHYFRMATPTGAVTVKIQAQVKYTLIRDYGNGHYKMKWNTDRLPASRVAAGYELLEQDIGSFELWPVVENGQVVGTVIKYNLWTDPAVDKPGSKWTLAKRSISTFTGIKLPELYSNLAEKVGQAGGYKQKTVCAPGMEEYCR